LAFLLDSVEIRHDILFDVLLVLFLVDLHDGKLLGKASRNIIANLDKVSHGKFSALDNFDQLVMIGQLVHELGVNRFLDHFNSPIPHNPRLSLCLQGLIIGFDDLDTVDNIIPVLLRVFVKVCEA
jgi:hypothetical protein